MYMSISSRSSLRVTPCSSSNSACDELGHEVVGRVLGRGGRCTRRTARCRRRRRRPIGTSVAVVVDAQALVDPVADRHLVLLGDAEQHPDGEHRHDRTEVGDEVEARPRPTSGSRVRAQNSRTFGSIASIAFGVNTRDIRLRCRSCDRRVLHEDRARRHLDAGQDHLERRALARAERVPVDEGLLDVVVAGQRVEVVLLVPVQRRLVAHPLPERVRVFVDLDVERVVVDVALVRDRHGERSSRAGRRARLRALVTVPCPHQFV